MSFRDLRNFSEDMRALGFPEPISLESFRTPHWTLLASCLRWLAARLEPDVVLAGGADTVEQRVALVMNAVQLFYSRAGLRLSGARLYGADGWAVRELLKASALLRAAMRAPPAAADSTASHIYDISSRIDEIKQARTLATDLTAQGAFLHDLLAREPDNREVRERALSRPLELSACESALRRAVSALGQRVAAGREHIDGVAASEAALDAKLERRRAELQRAEKRLHTVQKIKPVYQSELTALEGEVEALWEQYVLRYRCVEALKHQLSVLETRQNEAAEEQQASILQLIHKYEAEDVLGKLSDSDDLQSSGSEEPKPRPATRPRTRLRIKTAGRAGSEARGGGGAVWAGRDSLDIRDEGDSLSDSDADLSDAQLYLGANSGRAARWSRRPGTRTLAAHDDHYADLLHGGEHKAGGEEDSLGSSTESELRLGSPKPGRASALSDNEF